MQNQREEILYDVLQSAADNKDSRAPLPRSRPLPRTALQVIFHCYNFGFNDLHLFNFSVLTFASHVFRDYKEVLFRKV